MAGVLVVEDEPAIAESLAYSLRREGYTIVTAETAEGALRILGERPVDAILSDQKMPGMSGAQLLAEAARLRPSAVRMLITGWTEEIPPERLEALGVCALITKPWDDSRLKATLRRALGDS